MKKEDLCPGKADVIWIDTKTLSPNLQKAVRKMSYVEAWDNRHIVKGIKRVKMKCQLCGARVWSSIHNDHDGIDISHRIPPHKPKFWWKKNKKRKNK